MLIELSLHCLAWPGVVPKLRRAELAGCCWCWRKEAGSSQSGGSSSKSTGHQNLLLLELGVQTDQLPSATYTAQHEKELARLAVSLF